MEPGVRANDAARPVEMMPGVVRRSVAWGERAHVVELRMRKGSSVPPHSHPHEQCGYLISGRFEFTIGGKTQTVEPGGGWFVPGGVEHSVNVLEDSVAIDVFSPVREEYLDR